MRQLNAIALRITAHAEENETLRVSECQTFQTICEGVITLGEEGGYAPEDVRFADFLLAIIVRLLNGQGIRPAHRG